MEEQNIFMDLGSLCVYDTNEIDSKENIE